MALGAIILVGSACQDVTRPGPPLELQPLASKAAQCPSVPKTTTAIRVVPATFTVAPGGTRLLSLVDQSGRSLNNCSAVWASSNVQQATVSALGVVSGVGIGQSTITASVSVGRLRLTTTAVATVVRPVASVTVSAARTRLLTDSTSQATVVLKDADGALLSSRSIAWSSSDPTVATVSTSGLVSALKAGSVSITATSEGVSNSLSFTTYLNPKNLGIVYALESSLQLYSMRADGSDVSYVAPGVHPTQVGNVLIARGALGDGNLYAMAPSGTERRFLLGNGPNYVPDFNTAGTRFVHMRSDCGTNSHYVAITNADGTGTTVSALCTMIRPVWSPTGDVIAFGEGNKLFTVSSTFGTITQVLDVSTFGSFDFLSGLSWSPDGSRLFFSARPTGEAMYSLYVVGVNGTGLMRLTPGDGNGEVAFDWSRQGDWLLFSSRRTGSDQIWIRSLDGHMQFQLTKSTVSTERHDPRFTR